MLFSMLSYRSSFVLEMSPIWSMVAGRILNDTWFHMVPQFFYIVWLVVSNMTIIFHNIWEWSSSQLTFIYFKIVTASNQLLLMPNMSMHLKPSPSPGWFCGPECQRSAWPTHKLSCGRLDSKASKDRAESAKLEPTSSEKTLDFKLRCVFHT